MTPEQIKAFKSIPLKSITNWISDSVSEDLAITATTFTLAMAPEFREVDPIEFLDACLATVRNEAIKRIHDQPAQET